MDNSWDNSGSILKQKLSNHGNPMFLEMDEKIARASSDVGRPLALVKVRTTDQG
jgi:hypothetical protein